MKFGYFDDESREYVITTPTTPLPWLNYLGSGEFFRLISNTAGGYCFYRDARLLRSGIRAGSRRRLNWTVTPAATAWAIP